MDWNERRHIVDYDSAVGMRYHGRRKAFLDGLARTGPAASVIFGSAAFTGVVADWHQVALYASFAVAAISAVNLAFGIGDRARLHDKLFREWAAVQGDLARLDIDDDVGLRVLEARRTEIDADSPNQLIALATLCENEEKRMRRSGTQTEVGWAQRIVANWFTLPGWVPTTE